jgi:small subunit ribosomal protein S17
MKANIGIDVKPPEGACTDKKCPFHGELPVRGQVIEGVVKSASMIKTVVVERTFLRNVPKYERRERRFSKYHAHLPDCIKIKRGDVVRIAECRKLAKTVSFVVVEKVE